MLAQLETLITLILLLLVCLRAHEEEFCSFGSLQLSFQFSSVRGFQVHFINLCLLYIVVRVGGGRV